MEREISGSRENTGGSLYKNEPILDVEAPPELQTLKPDTEYLLKMVEGRLKVYEQEEQPAIYRHTSGMVFDSDSGELKMPNSEAKKLVGFRAKILGILLENPERVISKKQFATSIWTHLDIESSQNMVRVNERLKVHISKIREAIGNDPESPIIETIRGKGYMLSGKVERVEPEDESSLS